MPKRNPDSPGTAVGPDRRQRRLLVGELLNMSLGQGLIDTLLLSYMLYMLYIVFSYKGLSCELWAASSCLVRSSPSPVGLVIAEIAIICRYHYWLRHSFRIRILYNTYLGRYLGRVVCLVMPYLPSLWCWSTAHTFLFDICLKPPVRL